jgi:hypothetical protein
VTDALALRLVTILQAHRGLARAVSVADLAEQLGLGREKAGQRRVQMLKRELVEQGYPIGSSCSTGNGGYYWPETQAEVEATLRQYSHRFYSLSVLIKQTRNLLPAPVSPQLGLHFEEGGR